MLSTVRNKTIERSAAEALRIFISAGDFRYKEHEERYTALTVKKQIVKASQDGKDSNDIKKLK